MSKKTNKNKQTSDANAGKEANVEASATADATDVNSEAKSQESPSGQAEKPEQVAGDQKNGAAAAEPEVTEKEEPPLDAQEQAEKRAAEYFEHSFLRASSELENLRRRVEKRISEAHKFALSDFAIAMGEVRDCLEAAVDADGDAKKIQEGLALTLRKLTTAMDVRHILPIRPDVGVDFDPAMHNAIGTAPATPAAPENTVAVVVQSGYMLNGRVLRAANVMVSRAATGAAANDKAGKPAEE